MENDKRTKCEIWSRVMGYHRPLDQWNAGKKQEHKDRKHFIELKALKEEKAARKKLYG